MQKLFTLSQATFESMPPNTVTQPDPRKRQCLPSQCSIACRQIRDYGVDGSTPESVWELTALELELMVLEGVLACNKNNTLESLEWTGLLGHVDGFQIRYKDTGVVVYFPQSMDWAVVI
ncbi:hypothetical protein TWF225_011529 [Orbilia oligospora]|uniref:Uncharacterized protein n=1 Tax=Orbilia oligospora TaxID=2813651 RepID=A0A8H2DV52_ORBOL|nr:hypothetical protein TWF225_011529 [Orbilia oligospora]KAF3243762.1 hypothetical protein TWF128_009956 [Orbilia oligospora]KAF3294896.1 hypothetical protein TWF132_002813 [Orbilia oligospora]TGJ65487.1 hypothetical protein EYR41_009450 [Orbilia oligospora]